ncbi:MAG: GNAT family N-acetyltransferase [Chitinophagaceae bacterium]|nr:GNAT family N-acetyltransferase [Chitinophagaceae bacterium]
MITSITYRKAELQDLPRIKELLLKSYLPASDLGESAIDFIIAETGDNNVAGCIGVERYCVDGLLRSFAVDKLLRSKHIGSRLLNDLLSNSREKNIQQLHLLTTTAEKYFERAGFIAVARSEAPHSIRSTTEFSSLCPSSSAYIVKNITQPLNMQKV